MAESDLRSTVNQLLRPLDAVAVENPAYPGTPDVNYIGGWIELKWERSWPERGGVLKVEHYTQQQKTWGKRRWMKGGRVCLLLVCGGEWLIFDPVTAAEVVGKSNREQLIERCVKHWPSKPDRKELIECVLAISPRSPILPEASSSS